MSRTVVDLRDDLVRTASRLTGVRKKVELVNLALERLIRQKEIEKLLHLKGSVRWKGSLKEMRRERFGSSR